MKKAIWFGIPILVAGILILIIGRLPVPFDTDLSKIGQGTPVLVIAHDHGTMNSMMLLDDLGDLRDTLEPQLLLVVADLNHPDGARFARRHDLSTASATLFEADGRRVTTYLGHRDRADLIAFLDERVRPRLSSQANGQG